MTKSKLVGAGIAAALVLCAGLTILFYPVRHVDKPQPQPKPVPVVVDDPVKPLSDPTEAEPIVLPERVCIPKVGMTKLPAKALGKIIWVTYPTTKGYVQVDAYSDHLQLARLTVPPDNTRVYQGAFTEFKTSSGAMAASPVRWVEFTFAGRIPPVPTPEPEPIDPTPKPDPVKPDPPAPAKTAAHVIAIICEETRNRTPAQAQVMFNKGMLANFEREGHAVFPLDVSDPAYKSSNYDSYIQKAGGIPAVIIFDADKQGVQDPLAVFKLPTSSSDLEAGIRKTIKK